MARVAVQNSAGYIAIWRRRNPSQSFEFRPCSPWSRPRTIRPGLQRRSFTAVWTRNSRSS